MDYDQYLKECKKIKERNYLLLDLFKDNLIQSGLKDKTISRHLSNVEFYINEFLLYMDAYPMEEGLNMLDDYLGNFYIRKCLVNDTIKTFMQIFFYVVDGDYNTNLYFFLQLSTPKFYIYVTN